MMNKKYLAIPLVFLIGIVFLILILTDGHNVQVFNPKGWIAVQQRDLIVIAVGLMLVLVVPTFIILYYIVWKYRSGNHNAKYTPNLEYKLAAKITLWAIPTVLIIILAVINWKSTHALDPYKPLQSSNRPITIQVVALQWKWLFIYPEQNIATVNFIQFPVNTPINFKLTADAPMSSFWIPQLGGQIYAMTGMSTQTHLIANALGDFRGSDAEINGIGIAGMKFIARSSSQVDFETWVQSVKASQSTLDLTVYNKLAKPSEDTPVAFYASTEEDLYNKIVMKFMIPPPLKPTPTDSGQEMPEMQGMEH